MSFRIRGFLIHLFASLLMALITLTVIYKVWYPAPLDSAVGVTSIFFILLGVDVIVGPLLTLAVCKEGKKSLAFDISIIIAIQLSAFIYGAHIIAQGRPAWIVFSVERFELVPAFSMDNEFSKNAPPEYKSVSWTGPKWVAVKIPENKDLLLEGFLKGVAIYHRGEFFESLSNQNPLIIKKALPLDTLNNFNSKSEVSKALKTWPAANAYVPLKGPNKSLVVLIKRESGEVVATVDLRPWK